jgi:hypothetical protein
VAHVFFWVRSYVFSLHPPIQMLAWIDMHWRTGKQRITDVVLTICNGTMERMILETIKAERRIYCGVPHASISWSDRGREIELQHTHATPWVCYTPNLLNILISNYPACLSKKIKKLHQGSVRSTTIVCFRKMAGPLLLINRRIRVFKKIQKPWRELVPFRILMISSQHKQVQQETKTWQKKFICTQFYVIVWLTQFYFSPPLLWKDIVVSLCWSVLLLAHHDEFNFISV